MILPEHQLINAVSVIGQDKEISVYFKLITRDLIKDLFSIHGRRSDYTNEAVLSSLHTLIENIYEYAYEGDGYEPQYTALDVLEYTTQLSITK